MTELRDLIPQIWRPLEWGGLAVLLVYAILKIIGKAVSRGHALSPLSTSKLLRYTLTGSFVIALVLIVLGFAGYVIVERTQFISGVVLAEGNNPVEGAKISIDGYPDVSGITHNGSFSVALPSGPRQELYVVRAQAGKAQGYKEVKGSDIAKTVRIYVETPQKEPLQDQDTKTEGVKITVEKRVVDAETKNPVAHATVKCASEEATKTNGNGMFSCKATSQAGQLEVSISMMGYQEFHRFIEVGSKKAIFLQPETGQFSIFSKQVIDASTTKPVVQARVFCGSDESTETDGSGVFSCGKPVHEDQVEISIEKQGYQPFHKYLPVTADKVIRLLPSHAPASEGR